MAEHSSPGEMFKTDISNSQLEELLKLRGKFHERICKYSKSLTILALLEGISETVAVTSSIATAATIIRNSLGLGGVPWAPTHGNFRIYMQHSGMCLLSSASCAVTTEYVKIYREKLNKVRASYHVIQNAIDVFDNTLPRSRYISRADFESLCDTYHRTLEDLDKLYKP